VEEQKANKWGLSPQARFVIRRIARFFWKLAFRLMVAFMVLFFIFQLPPVQRYLLAKVTRSLSEKLETKVEIGDMHIGFLSHFSLKKVYVEDTNGDTLLYAGRIDANLNLNPVSLLSRGLVIYKVRLSDISFVLMKKSGEEQNNLERFIAKLFPGRDDKKEKEKGGFQLDVKRIGLERIHFRKADYMRGNVLDIVLGTGDVLLNKVDLPNEFVDIVWVKFDDFQMLTENHPVDSLFVEDEVVEMEDDLDTSKWKVAILDFDINHGQYSLHNYFKAPVKESADDEMDFRHLMTYDVKLAIDSFTFEKEVFHGIVRHIEAKDSSGFVLTNLSGRDVTVSDRQAVIKGLEIETPYSHIGDELTFDYDEYLDFQEFVDNVKMNLKVSESTLALRDIVSFAPKLKGNTFFTKNRDTKLKISGQVKGVVNHLRAKKLSIELPDGSILEGKLGTNDITVKDEENFNLKLTRLTTTVQTLRDLIPNFNPDKKFDNLGRLTFKGRFDGFLNDFVAKGNMVTPIGNASMNMRLDTKRGLEKAFYSGDLQLNDFDLGRLFENRDIGVVNFQTEVVNGNGLTLESINTELSAVIKDFTYKGYRYRNAVMVGKLQKNLFDGDFSIQDENINFSFKGGIDMKDVVPRFNFKADIANLDFKALNLSEQNLALSGKVNLNLRNKTLADLTGKVLLTDFIITKDDVKYDVDNLVAFSQIDSTGNKRFYLKSDVIDAAIVGKFNVEKLHTTFLSFFRKNYPEFVDHLHLKLPEKDAEAYDFKFNISIMDSKGLNWLVDDKLGTIKDLHWNGYYSAAKDSLNFSLDLPKLRYDNIDLFGINTSFSGKDSIGNLYLEIVEVQNHEKHLLSQINILSGLREDTLAFQLNYAASDTASWDNISLTAELTLPSEELYQLSVTSPYLSFLQDEWQIDPFNKVVWGKEQISFSNFVMSNGVNQIVISDNGTKGMRIDVDNLNFNLVDKYWDYDKLDFEGVFKTNLVVEDVFKQEHLELSVQGDSLLINNDYYGQCNIVLSAPDIKSKIDADLMIKDGTHTLEAKGYYNLKGPKGIRKVPYNKRAKYLNFDLDVKQYPLAFSEYFIAPGVQNVVGMFDLHMTMQGFFPNPDISGFIKTKNGAFTIDYLKTRYSFDESTVDIQNYLFDASGTVIHDKYGHVATIEGGLTHDHLRDLGVDARLIATRFLALETTRKDNNLYFGHALGTGVVEFEGPLRSVDIYVNASVADSTHIVMPIGATEDSSSPLSDVRFVNKHAKKTTEKQQNEFDVPEGVSFEMDLDIQEEAVMEMVFDEQAGDIIRGQGRGNIRMSVPYGEEFKMYGNYYIEKGSYLFTKIIINKDFDVKQGGTIQWSGDPFGAQINIDAKYNKLKTSLYNFIADDLGLGTDPDILNEANKLTDVDLTLHLTGELLKPIISFDISFPNLAGPLQTIAENKLRLLKDDPDELNKQVFALVVLGQFLPSDVALGNTGTALSNTVSEFLSNQFSVLVTNLFSEAFGDNRVFSDLSFDIAYNSYNQLDYESGNLGLRQGSDFQVSFSKSFFDGRFSFTVGGVVNDYKGLDESTTGTFIGDDVVFEYIINKNRTLKLRVYHKIEPDITGKAVQRAGVGLRYRKEFNSFSEFWQSFKKEGKTVRNDER